MLLNAERLFVASEHRVAQKQREAEDNGCGYECISEGTEAERECKLELVSWSNFACSLSSNEGVLALNRSCSPSGRIKLSDRLAFLLKVV